MHVLQSGWYMQLMPCGTNSVFFTAAAAAAACRKNAGYLARNYSMAGQAAGIASSSSSMQYLPEKEGHEMCSVAQPQAADTDDVGVQKRIAQVRSSCTSASAVACLSTAAAVPLGSGLL
jgi:hypothetical protein